jgi:outer membrane protein W
MRQEFRISVVLCALAGWGVASAAEGPNVVRFGVGYVAPTGDLSGPVSISADLGDGTTLAFEGTLTLEPQSEMALFFAYERRFSDLLGAEVAVWNAKHDVDGRLAGTYWLLDSGSGMLIETGPLDFTEKYGDVSVMPFTVGLDFHLTPKARVDLYAGPFVAYVFYGDFEVEGESLGVEDDVTWGGVVGLDVPIGKGGWLLTGAVRYLDTEAEPENRELGGDPIDVTPWVAQLSAGVRF